MTAGGCHGEATRSFLARVRGDVVTRFHAVAAKHRSSTRNSQFDLLGQIFLHNSLDVKESDDHALDIAFQLSGLLWP